MLELLKTTATVVCGLSALALLLAWVAYAIAEREERARERATLAAWNRDHAKYTPPPTWHPRRNDPERES